jgi:acyl carrier protein
MVLSDLLAMRGVNLVLRAQELKQVPYRFSGECRRKNMERNEKHMTNVEFLNEIDAIIEAKPGTTAMDDQLASLASWDSMATISFIAMADEKLGLALNADQLASCKTVGDLVKLCAGKVD